MWEGDVCESEYIADAKAILLIEETEAHVIVGLLLWQNEWLYSDTVEGHTFSSTFFSSSAGAAAAAAPPEAPPAAAAPPEETAPPEGTEDSLAEPSEIN
jgi:hypothetical protein